MTKPMTKELAQELVGLFDLTGWHDMQKRKLPEGVYSGPQAVLVALRGGVSQPPTSGWVRLDLFTGALLRTP